MEFFRQVVAVLCLILAIWALVAPVSGSAALQFILPAAGFLLFVLLVLRLPIWSDDFRALGLSFAFAALRAPPRQ